MYIFGPVLILKKSKKNSNLCTQLLFLKVIESHSTLKKEKRNQKLQLTITFMPIMTLCKLLTTTVRPPVFEIL